MKKSGCVVAVSALFMSMSLWASSKTYKKGFEVTEPVQVQNITLPPGHYEVAWTQVGQHVPVTILKNNKAIATVPRASVVEEKTPYSSALELTKEPNGTEELMRIDFSNVAVILPGPQASR